MNNEIEYFWETENKFRLFLKDVFKDKYLTKYSLTGSGIYNLLFFNNKIYEIKYTQTKNMIPTDNHSIDIDKKYIIDEICKNLKVNANISGGKFITFPVCNWFAKVEIIKKLKIPS